MRTILLVIFYCHWKFEWVSFYFTHSRGWYFRGENSFCKRRWLPFRSLFAFLFYFLSFLIFDSEHVLLALFFNNRELPFVFLIFFYFALKIFSHCFFKFDLCVHVQSLHRCLLSAGLKHYLDHFLVEEALVLRWNFCSETLYWGIKLFKKFSFHVKS